MGLSLKRVWLAARFESFEWLSVARHAYAAKGRMPVRLRDYGQAAAMKKATAMGGPEETTALMFLVPVKRVELPTFALRMRCSTN